MRDFILTVGFIQERFRYEISYLGNYRKVVAMSNPYSTVYADGIELANNQNSSNWSFCQSVVLYPDGRTFKLLVSGY